MSAERLNVAAVCGNEMRVYGGQDPKTGIRPFMWREVYQHHGRALEEAMKYDERQRQTRGFNGPGK